MSLPFGVRTSDNPLPGHATSAPEHPMIWRKVLASTCIAGVLTFVVYCDNRERHIHAWHNRG